MANRFLNNIKINDSYTLPPADGTADQIIKTDGLGELSFVDQGDIVAGEAEIAKTLQVAVKNVSGGELTKGTVVHVSPSASPPSGNIVEVIAADYDDATKMPAVGILKETIADDVEGEAVMAGALSGIATDSFTAGDELYVGADGALTNAKPQTAGQLIQKIAVCVKSHASNGLIKIFGAGRSNDVPLPLYIDHANQRLGIGTPSPSELLHIEGTLPEVLIKGTGVYDASVITMSNGSGDSSFITNYNNPGVKGLWLKYDNGSTGDATIKVGQNELLFDVNNGTAMYINSLRNVGIGTTSPAVKLHVGSTSTSGATTEEFRLQSGTSSGDGGTAIANLVTGNFGTSGIYFGNNTTYSSQPAYLQYRRSDNNTTLKFDVRFNIDQGSSGTRFNINSSGNVGIGATNPTFVLDIGDSQNDNDVFRVNGSNADVLFSGNTTAPTGGVGLWNFINTGTNATTRFYVQDANNSNDRLTFRFTGNGGSNEILSGTSSGRVGIGATNPGAKLDVVGNIKMTETAATTDTDKFVVLDSGVLKYRTGSQVISDLPIDARYVAVTGDTMTGTLFINKSGSAQIKANNRAVFGTHYTSTDVWIYGGTGDTILLGGGIGNIQNDVNVGNGDFTVSNGSVGIGTTSPGAKLHISESSSASTANLLYLENTGSGGSEGVSIKFNPVFSAESMIASNREGAVSNASNLTFHTATSDTTTERMRITSDGNVGIGTSSPQSKLHVSSDSDPTIIVGTTTANQANSGKISFRELPGISEFELRYNGSSNRFDVWNSIGGEAISVLRSNSNVGIGTTSPGEKLSVAPATDASGEFGQAHVGNVGYSGYAGFSHVDRNSGGNYALLQHSNGLTYLNASSGQSIRFRIDNSDKMILDSLGNVGIGDTSPDATLTVFRTSTSFATALSTAESRAGLSVKSTSTYDAKLTISTGTSGIQQIQGVNNAATTGMDIAINPYGGNVGIGTTSPNHELVVQGTSSPNIELKNSNYSNGGFVLNRTNYTQQWKWWAENSQMYFSFATDESTYSAKMTIQATGNVGIGTTSPRTKLHISGLTGDDDPSLGASTAPLFVSNTANSYGLNIGVNNVGAAWLQAQSNTSSIAYNLLLNPLGGNVGIGTTGPGYKLDVAGTGRFTSYLSFNNQGYIRGDFSGELRLQGGTTATTFYNSSNSSELMRITQAGNVGIGTTSPAEKLHVYNGSAYITPIAYAANQNDWVIRAGAYNNTAFDQGLKLKSTSTGASYMAFETTAGETMVLIGDKVGIGTASPGEKLDVAGDIKSTGSIYTGYDSGVTNSISCSNWFRTTGTTGIFFASYGGGLYMTDSTYVTVYNNKAFEVNNTGTSSIRAAGDIVAYYSDERLKTNLGNITNAVDKVKKLNGFYYKNNELANSFGYTEDHLQVGVSAQEVEAIMPEVVKPAPFDLKNKENGESYSASGENYKTVKYEKLVPLLIEAIKEQQKQIDELKNQLDAFAK